MASPIGQRLGICGFLAPAGCGDAGARLQSLSDGLTIIGGGEAVERNQIAHALADHRSGLVAAPGFEAADVSEIDGWRAAIRGRPLWLETSLSETAKRNGDASALLEGHRKYGADVLDHVTGSFALAVINAGQGYALLAIDRMGIEALCWATTPNGELAFATTALGVKAYPGVDPTLSSQALYDFLFFYAIPGPQTIFKEVRKISPGCRVIFENGQAQAAPYWRMPYSDPDAEIDAAAPPETSHRDLLEALEQAVGRSLAGLNPEKTGAFLSGGLDSSTVTGLIQRISGCTRSFTIGFPEARLDESSYARLAAEHFSAEYNQLILKSDEAIDILPQLAGAFDEPFANSSAIPTYFCARMARDHGVDVLIAGDGGDELFAGNERYSSMRRYDIYGRIPGLMRRGGLDAVLSLPLWSGVPILRKAQRLMRQYNLPLAKRVYSGQLHSVIPDNQIFNSGFLSEIDNGGPQRLIDNALVRHKSHDDIQSMMGMDLTLTLADNDLRKVTGACHLAGVGVRYPMLDDALVGFAASMPSALLMPGGELRSFFKSAMCGFLPDQTLSKAKHGFGAPQDAWARTDGAIREFYTNSIQNFAERGILNKGFVDRLIASCGPTSKDTIISSAYDIVMLQQWLAKHG